MMTVKELRDYLDQLCREGKEYYEVKIAWDEVLEINEGDIDIHDKGGYILL